MKTWTIVVEVTTNYDEPKYHGVGIDKQGIEDWMTDTLKEHIGSASFRIMETIEAPYGPQHSGGVFIIGKKP